MGVTGLVLIMTPPIAFLFGKYLSKGIKDSNSKEDHEEGQEEAVDG